MKLSYRFITLMRLLGLTLVVLGVWIPLLYMPDCAIVNYFLGPVVTIVFEGLAYFIEGQAKMHLKRDYPHLCDPCLVYGHED